MGSKAKVPKWFEGWKDKYSSALVEGLTDGPTYVRLARKECPMLDVQLALRPYVMRITENKIALCGKLSVFPIKDTLKAAPANEEVMANWLAAAFPDVEFPKRSGQRVGTIILTLADAPMNAKKAFKVHWAESKMVDSLLDWIEGIGHLTVADRKLAARALKEAYGYWLDTAFYEEDGPDTAKVGEDGEIAHGNNILQFMKKKVEDAGEADA